MRSSEIHTLQLEINYFLSAIAVFCMRHTHSVCDLLAIESVIAIVLLMRSFTYLVHAECHCVQRQRSQAKI